jgi:hypothetical protein
MEQMTKGWDGPEGQSIPGPMMMRELTETEVEAVAKGAHEMVRAYSAACGDLGGLPWELASEEQRQGVIAEVKYQTSDGRRLGIHYNMMLAEATHNRWLERKLRDGWRYGPTKSEQEKTHPCLLPWRSLQKNDQQKDYVFLVAVAVLDPRP